MFELFYKNRYLLFATIAFITIFGIIGLIFMPKKLFPDANRPEIVIFTTLKGASSKIIATSISKPIEEEMATLSDIYEIKSTSTSNFSIVHVIFNYTKTLSQAAVDVSNALNKIKTNLPKDALSEIYLVGDFMLPVDVFALSSNTLNTSEIRKIAQNYIKPALLRDKNIGNVEIFGGSKSAIEIKIDPIKMLSYSITLKDLITSLKTNFTDIPIGYFNDNKFITLTYYANSTIEKIKNFQIKGVKLKDFANVSWSYSSSFSKYIGNNKEAIAISVLRPVNGDVLKTSKAARKIIEEFKQKYPNINFEISNTQVNLIEMSNKNMLEALRDAILYTLLVLIFFLGNTRALIAAGVSIPLVFLGVLAYLFLTNQELNIVIYTAIILALGLLVDDAVVVLENIQRHLKNENLKDAIYNGTKEVLGPIFAGTIATSAIILPLMFVGGYPEKIFKPLITTLIAALFISWFISITVIPVISNYLYKNGYTPNSIEKFFEKIYQNSFAKLINLYVGILEATKNIFVRVFLIIGAIAFLIFSIKTIFPLIGRDLMPPMDTGIIKAKIEFSNNYSANKTLQELKPFINWLKEQDWVEKTSFAIGTEKGVLSLSGGTPNSVMIDIIAIDRFHRKKSIWELEEEIREKIAKLKNVKEFAVYDFGATALSSISAPITIEFSSNRYEDLFKYQKVKNLLYNINGITTISTPIKNDSLEIVVEIDNQKAIKYNLNPLTISAQIPLKEQEILFTTLFSSFDSQKIKLYLKKEYQNLEFLKNYPIITPKGIIPLSEVANIHYNFTTNKITRRDLKYTYTIQAYKATTPITILNEKVDKILKSHNITNYSHQGDLKELNDSFKRLIKAIVIGVILLIIALMVIYKSLKLALVMIVVLPLSIIGASWALLIANKPTCMPSMVGILLLFGIIIKNSVLLIDFYNEFIKNSTPFEAAKEAIKVRFRPVFMTAFGTIAGMIPIALERAIGLERLSPIADVAIGGLLVGTFLTLVYVPLFAYITHSKK